MAGNFVTGIISLTIGVVMMTQVLLPQLKGANTSGWSTGEVALWAVGSTFAIIGILYGIATVFGLV